MAKQTSLDEFYYLAYFLPTMHSNATSMSIDQRLKHYENDSIGFDEISQSEIEDKALIISHHLIIRLIEIQNSYFNLGLNDDLHMLISGFKIVWEQQRDILK
jgi:hypothetical protein